MTALAITNTFVASTTAESAKVNTNFDDIETYINNRNSGVSTWDNMNATTAVIGALTLTSLSFLPAGTKLPFYQASPPTGWTAVAVNDKFMRVVTSAGTGGTNGGSVAASTSLAHTHTVASHTHAIGNHTHSVPVTQIDYDEQQRNGNVVSGSGTGAGNSEVRSDDTDATYMYDTVIHTAGSNFTHRRMKNTTKAATTGVGSADATAGATPATDSQLGVFAYADFCVGTKD